MNEDKGEQEKGAWLGRVKRLNQSLITMTTPGSSHHPPNLLHSPPLGFDIRDWIEGMRKRGGY